MTTRTILGLAAGASLAGIEAVLVEIQDQGLDLRVEARHWLTESFPRDLRELLVRVSTAEQGDVRQVSLAHRLLGEAAATAACKVADAASASLQSIQCLGFQGFTAWHEGDGRWPSNLTLGAPAYLAERTGLSVVSDFRARDLACSGQGTPIAAIVDGLLFSEDHESRVVLHLGGLGQIVYLPASDLGQRIQGWEIGPCNVLLDALIQQLTGGKERIDAVGKYAVQGRQLPDLLECWLNHPFHLKRPPKGTHRAAFGEEFVRQTLVQAQQKGWNAHDLLCTAHRLIARLIADDVQRHLPRNEPPARMILTGGGVKNGLLWRLLQEHLPDLKLERSEEHGVPAEPKEALNAAVLAALTLDGVPGNLPSATGASGSRLLGTITPGSTTNWSRCLAWMTGQGHYADEE